MPPRISHRSLPTPCSSLLLSLSLPQQYGCSNSLGETDSESEPESPPRSSAEPQIVESECNFRLPPPPLSLLNPPNSLGGLEELLASQPSKVRNFPHVEGNYALHVYIPEEGGGLVSKKDHLSCAWSSSCWPQYSFRPSLQRGPKA